MARKIKDENVQIERLLQQARENKKVLQSEMIEPCGLTKNHIIVILIFRQKKIPTERFL